MDLPLRQIAVLSVFVSLFVTRVTWAEGPAEVGAVPVAWLEGALNERGQRCESHAEQRDEQRVLVACGPAGVWEVALEESGPRFVRSHEFAGEAVGLFTEPGGRLWVKLQVVEARPFSALSRQPKIQFPDAAGPRSSMTVAGASAPPAPSSPAAAAPSVVASRAAGPAGRVLRAARGEVVISLGSAAGVARGDRIDLTFGSAIDDSALDAPGGETLAIGVVTQVSEHSARVRLGLNEGAPVGSLAIRSMAATTASLVAPPRASSVWSVEAAARPFAALGELGGGALLSAAVGYQFASPLRLQAFIEPLALATAKGGSTVNAINGALCASYDSRYFEMGLGLGGQSVNEAGFFLPPGSGLSAAQIVRLGARDGLNLSARSSVVLFHSQFEFGAVVASFQIPVGRGYWLQLSGGGGNVGYGYGELGLRTLLSGNGQAGSSFLVVTAGGAGVFQSGSCRDFTCDSPVYYAGPMAGVGGEWRF